MRTFYVFKINDTFSFLTKDSPYSLFKSMEQIYYADKNDVDLAYNIYDQIIDKFDKSNLSNNIFECYKDCDYYTKYHDTHMYNNFFNNEQTKLIVNKSFMLIRSTFSIPTFFKNLSNYKNIFVCDFQNKDYFWLEKVLV